MVLVNDLGDSSGASLANVNGDGLVDIALSYDSTDALVDYTPDGGVFGQDGGTFADAGELQRVPLSVRAVFLNTGSGWTKNDAFSASLATVPAFVRDTQLQGQDVADINGDGAADIIRTLGGADRIVWLSNGRGWSLSPDYTASLQASQIVSLQDAKSQGLLAIDFNNDGLLDYVRADESVLIAYRNTGLGWVVRRDRKLRSQIQSRSCAQSSRKAACQVRNRPRPRVPRLQWSEAGPRAARLHRRSARLVERSIRGRAGGRTEDSIARLPLGETRRIRSAQLRPRR